MDVVSAQLRRGVAARLWVAAAMLVWVAPSLSAAFPEEARRSDWDRGCADWPEVVPQIGMGPAEKNPGIYIQKADGAYRVLVKMTFTPEKGESFDHFHETTRRLILEGAPYPSWVLPGINEKPGGGAYFVSVNGLITGEREPHMHYTLTGPYTFKLLWFERVGVTTIELRHDEVVLPPCDLFARYLKSQKVKASLLFDRAVYRMTPRPEILSFMIAEVYLLPMKSENKLEVRMRLSAKPSNFVYQLMPESMMRGEVEVRGRRIFQNLLDVRKTLAFSGASISSASSPSKPVAPLKKTLKALPVPKAAE